MRLIARLKGGIGRFNYVGHPPLPLGQLVLHPPVHPVKDDSLAP